MRKRAILGIALAASAAGAALPAQAAKTVKKTVHIYDNFYLPDKLTVKADTVVVWKWPDDAGDNHDVKLRKGPKKAKKFWSDPAAVAYTFKQKLKVPGTYHVICTLHEEMTMDIVVKKRRRPSARAAS